MKTWMKTTLAASLIALGAVGATSALARGGDCGGADKRGGQRLSAEHRAEHFAQAANLRLARLELALALAPEQRPAWDVFSGTLRERADRHGSAMAQRGERGERGKPQTAVERLSHMEQMSERMHAAAVQTREATEKFYATLSDAQKTVFDAEFSLSPHGERHGDRGGKRHEHRKGQPRG